MKDGKLFACRLWLGRGFQREGEATEKAQVWSLVLVFFFVQLEPQASGRGVVEEVGEVRMKNLTDNPMWSGSSFKIKRRPQLDFSFLHVC